VQLTSLYRYQPACVLTVDHHCAAIVAMWYARSKKYGEKNVMYDTYTWYNHMLAENSRITAMAEVLAGSAEYRALNKPRKEDEAEIRRLYQ
jgi:hypothetical protein